MFINKPLLKSKSRCNTKKLLKTDSEIVVEMGVFLAEKVFGKDIFNLLFKGLHARVLIVRLPDSAEDKLAGAFARVPYEIARASKHGQSLYERNLAVKIINKIQDSKNKSVEIEL